MKPLISLQNVSIRYKQSGNIFRPKQYFNALKSVSLEVLPGETLGIIGRNGAGKSTLLRLISGVIRPDLGIIINNDVSVSLLALQAGFDANLSGRDNAILTGIMHGLKRHEIETQLNGINAYAELGDFYNKPMRTYSTGMRARLAFSITTIISPDVLLIDEVLSVGDSQFKKKAELTMVEKIQSKQTVVLVTHSQQQILRLCDRAVLLDKGTSITSGKPEDVIKLYNQLV